MTNKEIAIAVVKAVSDGKLEALTSFIREDLIQHNVEVSTGRAMFLEWIKKMSQNATAPVVKVLRAITDRDFVGLHVYYKIGDRETVGLQIFRFHHGLLSEYWDNFQTMRTPNASNRTMIDGATKITDLTKTEENKDTIRKLQNAMIKGDWQIIAEIIDPNCKQHNPEIGDGFQSLKDALNEHNKNPETQVKFNTLHLVLGEGNFVLTTTDCTIGREHHAFFELFALSSGKVVESWDVISKVKNKKEIIGINNPFNMF